MDNAQSINISTVLINDRRILREQHVQIFLYPHDPEDPLEFNLLNME